MIQLFPSSANLLQHIADKQYQSAIGLSAFRGNIYDRRKAPLSISIKTPSVAINPKVFDPSNQQLGKLSQVLGLSKKKIRALAKKPKYFAWLKRKISYQIAEKLKKLELKGMHYVLEPSRYYPGGRGAANLLGYVGIDNVGLLGLEHAFDQELQGTSSKLISLKDARGHLILMNAEQITPEKTGSNIILTLDRAIQGIAEEALQRGIKKSEAKIGFAIVMDPHTGRILAMANHPNFNPNNPSHLKMAHTVNHSIAYRFEPGSVMKPFVVAWAIENRKTSPFEIHHCEKNGRYEVSDNLFIHDDHPKEFRTTEEILIHSSNICTFKVALRIGQKNLFESLKKFGFASDKPIIGLPGETTGSIAAADTWSPIRFANISFGQGLLVTGLEVIQAYASIANGGNLIKPYLVERVESSNGHILQDFSPIIERRVLSPQTAHHIARILEKVVLEGTATRARTKSYSTAGKTGTAEKIDPLTKSYANNKRIANFAGFAPVSDPHIAVYVVLDEPQKKPYYGGLWAAPVFSEIVEKTLKYLNVAPDLNATHPQS
ncbi:MAG: peptidoglycan D,D-transpeptidase FtsI family protein [Oligoflexales bacterium]